MVKKIKYPVGIQTFSEIINENFLYVDKTALVYKLVAENKYIFLSRPRRFGKSLLMSTLEAYFRGKKELFKGLDIEKLETKWDTYPVFRFDLSGENYNHPDRVVGKINRYLKRIEREYDIESTGESIADKFFDLIERVSEKTGKKVVLLVDEYDKPMLDCLHDEELHEKIRAELRGFYSVIKTCDEYIRFTMLTGVTKFGKVSVFSGLNNLKDISLNPDYNSLCGISESEFHRDFKSSITDFAEAHEIGEEEAWKRFKVQYDGYHFAGKGEYIYNPFSVLNAFDDKELGSYWFSSGSSDYLVKLIRTHRYNLSELEGVRRKESSLKDITDITYDIVPLLYQSGYLTIKDYDSESREYILGFPNREVNGGFWESLSNYFFRSWGGSPIFNTRLFVKDIEEGRVDDFMTRLKSLFSDTASVHESNKEIHFQNMVAIVAKMLGLEVRTEVESANGRCDMQIFTSSYVFLFEFKVDSTPEKALDQIKTKDYAGPFASDSREKILIGANFSSETRTLSDWVTERISKRVCQNFDNNNL